MFHAFNSTGVTVGFGQELYIAAEENGTVTVCAIFSSGASERSVLVTLVSADGDAEGTD